MIQNKDVWTLTFSWRLNGDRYGSWSFLFSPSPESTSILSSEVALAESNGSRFPSSSSESVLSSLSVLPELLRRKKTVENQHTGMMKNALKVRSKDLQYLVRLWASGAKVTSFSSQISSSSDPVSSNCWIFSLQQASKSAMFAYEHSRNKLWKHTMSFSINSTNNTHSFEQISDILTLSFVFKEKLMSDILSKGILQDLKKKDFSMVKSS